MLKVNKRLLTGAVVIAAASAPSAAYASSISTRRSRPPQPSLPGPPARHRPRALRPLHRKGSGGTTPGSVPPESSS